MKQSKGCFGYINAHKKSQFLRCLMFFVPALILVLVGLNVEKVKLLTVFGMLLCLPGCKEVVNLVLFLPKKSMDPALYKELKSHTDGMNCLYELGLTTYEKNYPISALVIKDSNIAAFTEKKDMDVRACEDHIFRILKDNGIKENVKIFTDKKKFLERVDDLKEKTPEDIPFSPDSRYPELSREEVIRHLILQISL